MALVTSTPRNHTEEFLERFNLKTYFSFIVTGDEILNGKPSPDPYLVAIKKLNLNSAECIVVEDALSGVRSGKSAGCVVVAIPTQHMDGLDYSEADFIIYDLNDLPPLLGIKC